MPNPEEALSFAKNQAGFKKVNNEILLEY